MGGFRFFGPPKHHGTSFWRCFTVRICGTQCRSSMGSMTFSTGSKAFQLYVIAGIPAKSSVAKQASKKGSDTKFATQMALKALKQSGSTELGSMSASKTVMAMAHARHTAALKQLAPTIEQRAAKALRCRSSGGNPSQDSSISKNCEGSR